MRCPEPADVSPQERLVLPMLAFKKMKLAIALPTWLYLKQTTGSAL